MRLNTEITLAQQIVNNANHKQDFTINITNEKSKNNRYIVSSLNLYTGFNPSLKFDLLTFVDNMVINNNGLFDSVGGWLNKETNIYTLDMNIHFNDLDFALKFAKVNKQIAIFDKITNQCLYLNNTKTQ